MIVTLLAALLWEPQQAVQAQPSDVDAFVKRHWRLPVPPQGEPPAAFSPIEASLHPKECALCHRQQFNDWSTSLHSRSMGPGIYGQLLNMQANNPSTYTICATCHTPLSEQIPHIKKGSEYRPNEAFDPELQQAGLVCAGCHVRQHQRFGPPRRPELPAPSPSSFCPTAVSQPRRRSSDRNSASRATSSPRAPSPSTTNCWRTPLTNGRQALTPRKAYSARAATCRTAATCGAASRTPKWCDRP